MGQNCVRDVFQMFEFNKNKLNVKKNKLNVKKKKLM